eukprot:NODE_6523_length_449_cov_102.175000_g4967_i0.p1 GENE.NODE_6523_length_449_cov_102.175000_g4967_i0~~NODE_6523_length_449_cov_102.175000_g4967_i0.p1  ORF type:complete len:121 (+),score=8.09 NODE_6523_length_449_cov_102.175000_g4967_i0:56-418(+)
MTAVLVIEFMIVFVLVCLLGFADGTVVTVETNDRVDEFFSAAMVNGKPAIGYYNYDNEHLYYVRASDAVGLAWAPPVAVDTSDLNRQEGQYPPPPMPPCHTTSGGQSRVGSRVLKPPTHR